MYINEFIDLFKNIYFQIFLILVLFDILTGVCKAFVKKGVSSFIGLQGMMKHVFNIVIVILILPFLTILKMSTYADIIILFYIGFYGLSNVENLSLIGVPFPKFVIDSLEVLKNKGGK